MRSRIFWVLCACVCIFVLLLEGHRLLPGRRHPDNAGAMIQSDDNMTVERLQKQIISLERRVAELERVTSPRFLLVK